MVDFPAVAAPQYPPHRPEKKWNNTAVDFQIHRHQLSVSTNIWKERRKERKENIVYKVRIGNLK